MQQGLCSQISKKSLSLDAIHMRFPHKAIERNIVQGDDGIPVCWLPHLPRSAWCLQEHGRWHPHGGTCQGEDRLPCYTRWYEYCNGVADTSLWKSKHREPNSCPNIVTEYGFLPRMTASSHLFLVLLHIRLQFCIAIFVFFANFATCFLLEFWCQFSNSDLHILPGQPLNCIF